MKQLIVYILLFLMITTGAQAQINNSNTTDSDSMTCFRNLSLYKEFLKLGSMEDAIPAWQYVIKNCPTAARYIYTDGEEIMAYRIDNATDNAQRKLLVDTLLMIYDQRIAHFGQKNFVLGKKCISAYKYGKEDTELMQKTRLVMQQVISETTPKTVVANIAYYLLIGEHLLSNNAIDARTFVEDYFYSRKSLQAVEQASGSSNSTQQISDNLDKIFLKSSCSDCERLSAVLRQISAAQITQTAMMLELMRLTSCSDSEYYSELAEQDFRNNQQHGAANTLARMFYKQDKFVKAMQYQQKASELLRNNLQTRADSSLMAEYLSQLSGMQLIDGQMQQARKSAQEAAGYRPGWGMPYMIMGKIYMSAAEACGNSVFEKQAVYWVAADKFAKAASVDSTFVNDAKTRIEQCQQQFPAKEEAFMNSVTSGSTYTVGCWIQEKTTARFFR